MVSLHLKSSSAIGMALAGFLPAGAASGDGKAPRWEINQLCVQSKSPTTCPRVESVNRSTVLARWSAVPAADRAACQAQVDVPGQRSYRRLLDCLDDRAMKALEGAPEAPVPPPASDHSG
jgi:hypothetical protein